MYRMKSAAVFAVAGMLMVCGGTNVHAEIGSSLLSQPISDTNEEHYAVANVSTTLNVRSGPGGENSIVGKLPQNGLMVLSGYQDGWCEIVSGDVTGFVSAEYLYPPEESKKIVETIGPDYLPRAAARSSVREELIQYASQFIGNPYVWGGTSLTNGADCSGYVQSVYREFGVELPRVSRDQANVGQKIPVESAQPGDLIFYARGGSIYHVVISLGDGQVLNASNEKKGICISNLNAQNAVWAVNVLD